MRRAAGRGDRRTRQASAGRRRRSPRRDDPSSSSEVERARLPEERVARRAQRSSRGRRSRVPRSRPRARRGRGSRPRASGRASAPCEACLGRAGRRRNPARARAPSRRTALPAAASTSSPFSRSRTVSPSRNTSPSRSALCRRRQRYGAVTSRSIEVGTAAACVSFSVSNGSTWRTRWFRQAMFGVTAEARLTTPARRP